MGIGASLCMCDVVVISSRSLSHLLVSFLLFLVSSFGSVRQIKRLLDNSRMPSATLRA